MTGSPLQLAVATALSLLLGFVGVLLLRAPGPLHPMAPALAVEGTLGDRTLAALGRPFLGLLATRWGRSYCARLDRWLLDAGRAKESTPQAEAQMQLGHVVLFSLVLAAFLSLGHPWIGLTFWVIGIVRPPARLARDASGRQSQIERDMPLFLELMAVLIASGHTFRFALDRVSGRLDGPLADEVRLFLNQLEFGYTPRDALKDLVRRSSAPTVRRMAAAIRQNSELGAPISNTLAEVAEDVRAEIIINFKLRAERAATRAGLVLVFVALPGVLGVTLVVVVGEALTNLSQIGF